MVKKMMRDLQACTKLPPKTEFKYGVSDRGASIRIPMGTANDKKGYLEDRRPECKYGSVLSLCFALIETTCS